MTQKELKELIKSIVQEYTGTGSSGGNAGDGNSITSQRSRWDDDEDEMDFYTNKNIYGAEGGHYRKDADSFNYNRSKFPMFEQENPQITSNNKKIAANSAENQKLQFQNTDIGIKDTQSANAIAFTQGQEAIDTAEQTKVEAVKAKKEQNIKITKLQTELDSLMRQETTDAIIVQRKAVSKEMEELKSKLPELETAVTAAIKTADEAISSRNKAAGQAAQSVAQMKKQAAQAKRDAAKTARQGGGENIQEQAYGHATLTTQGQSISRAPGIMEDSELADLYTRLAQKYRDQEETAEPEGGPIQNAIGDEIEALEKEISALKRGPKQDKSYTEVVLSKLAGPNDAKEYDNEKHQLIIYPGLGSLQYKSRSSQEIVFTHIEGQPAFVRAFGNRPIYDELKKVLPEIPSPGTSMYSGFINILADEPIPMDNETAIEMIKAMERGKDAEAGAQSSFYTREPGRGGTGIEERSQKHISKLIKQYLNERKNSNLMAFMDIYKKRILSESAVKKIFSLFDIGKSNEDVLTHYAKKGITVPEQFVTKIRKQYENLKKSKLEIEFSEQEAKDFKSIKVEKPENPKKISNRLFKEAKTIKKYPIPPEIKDALENTLKIYPLRRFISGLKAINSIPPSYRIFLHNSKYFDIIYEETSLVVKVGYKKYYLGNIEEKNASIKHINKLLIDPIIKTGAEAEAEVEETPPSEEPTT